MAFCPKCRNEYREGFTVCSDCKVALVEQLPEKQEEAPEEMPREVDASSLKFVSVFVSDDPDETEAVRASLTDNNVAFITRGEDQRRFRYVDFLVREDKLVEARNLLKDIISKEAGVDITAPVPDEGSETAEESPQVKEERLEAQRGVAPRKSQFNFSIPILLVSLLLLFALKIETTVKYFLAGGVMIVLIMTILFSREKRS